ncbi:MAG: PAS domain S-box protein [Thermodesulfobacteriota bacterium]
MTTDKISSKVAEKQLHLLYQQLPLSLFTTAAISLLLFLYQPFFVHKSLLQIWFALSLFIVLLRGITSVAYSRAHKQPPLPRRFYESLFLAGVILAGIVWGSLGWYIFPVASESNGQMIFFVALIGIAGGSMTTLSYRILPSYLFISLTLLPLVIKIYRMPGTQNLFVSVGLLAYVFFLLKIISTFQKNNTQILLMEEEARKREKKLQVSQEEAEANTLYLESILQSSTETAIIATDTNFRINYFNPKAEHIFGMKRNEVLGNTIQDIHALTGRSGKKLNRFDHIVDTVRQTGFYQFFIHLGPAHLNARINSIKDHNNHFAGFLLMINDITEEKQKEEKLRKLSRAVEQSHSTIVITDLAGNIEFVNPAFTRSTGYTRSEAIGHNPRLLKSELQAKSFYKSMWDTLTAGKVWQGELHNKRKDGTLYWEFATISPVKDKNGTTTHYVAVKEDITLRKETEQQLIKAHYQAETANQAKSSFLANMSHEIRTPINGIIGMTRLALQADLNDKTQHLHFLTTISSLADTLLDLINQILDFSKIEAGELQLENEEFNIRDTVDSALLAVSAPAKDKNLELTCEIPPEVNTIVRGDSLRLQQVLLNLLSNSVKFTDTGQVHVNVSQKATEDGRLEIHFQVRDTGCGIKKENIQSVFDSFIQGEAGITRRFGGTGLGLTICKKLCDLMGGDIYVSSEFGEGSTFRFYIVVEKTESEPAAITEKTSKPLSRLRPLYLLLVEDNEINRELARLTLENDHHTVLEAENGLLALSLLMEHRFDAVLMDLQMPEMDGLTATTIIRSCENGIPHELAPPELDKKLQGTHVPIIAMTAHAFSGDKQRCLEVGMDYYLTKPFKPEQLSQILAQAVAGAPAAPVTPTNTIATEEVMTDMRTHFKKSYGLEDEQIDQLILKFRENLGENLEQVERLMSEGDVTLLAPLFHTIKGVLLNAGQGKLAAKTAELEQLAKTPGSLSEVIDQYAEIRAPLEAMVEEV